METIVVGVDGSQGAEEALRYALAEARSRGARLRLVSVWRVPLMVYRSGPYPAVSREAFEQAGREALEQALALVEAHDQVEAETVLQEGQAASVLLEQAEDADQLVVGTRGLGGFGGLLLGSVSQQCVQHAPCPVTVVPLENQTDG